MNSALRQAAWVHVFGFGVVARIIHEQPAANAHRIAIAVRNAESYERERVGYGGWGGE